MAVARYEPGVNALLDVDTQRFQMRSASRCQLRALAFRVVFC
jgi:hypothetical protein